MLHFDRAEFAARQQATLAAMAEARLDALLVFRQESMFWLTGYDTFGYVYFQCLVLRADGRMALLTRRPDLLQAKLTSVIDDVRVWIDRADATPQAELLPLLGELGLSGKHLGIEFESYGLTGASCLKLLAALDGHATHEDASFLVSRLRLRKSPAEIAFVRRAAALADDALDAALRLAAPGADEATIHAAMRAAVLAGDGDDPGNPFIVGSGDHALLVRYASGRRKLAAHDQLTLEFAGTYRHYHACLMRTICVGVASPLHVRFHAAAAEALSACIDACRLGNTLDHVFRAHADTFDRAGLGSARLNACGYALGTTFQPNWMDWPMIVSGNPVVIEPGQVFFLHMILADAATNTAMAPGLTVLVGEAGAEVLSRHDIKLVVRS